MQTTTRLPDRFGNQTSRKRNNRRSERERRAVQPEQQTPDSRPIKRKAESKSSITSANARYRFLTQKIPAITHFKHQIKIDKEESDRLIGILKNFCKITGRTFPESFSEDPVARLAQTLSEINDKLSYENHINLAKDDKNKLHLIYEKDVMDYCTIYFIPIENTFTECYMSEEFGKITRRFIATFAKNNYFDTIDNTRTFGFMEEMQEELELQDEDEAMELDALKNYAEDSEAGNAMLSLQADISARPFTAKELLDYTPKENETELHDLLCEGLEFCMPKTPFTRYCGMFNEDEYNDMAISIDDIIVITYYEDSITEQMYMESINEEANSGYHQMRVLSCTELTEKMTEIKTNDYAERFLDFVSKLTRLLYSN